MNTQEFFKSKGFKIALGAVGAFLLIFISFAGGVAVGLHKAKFSYEWGKNYERNFMGFGRGANRPGSSFDDRAGMMSGGHRNEMLDFSRKIEGREFRNAHGLAGTIISIADNNLIVKDRDNKENSVIVTDKTIIKDRMLDIKITDLKANDQIIVMGAPSKDGVIGADLIRIFCCNENAEKTSNDNNSSN